MFVTFTTVCIFTDDCGSLPPAWFVTPRVTFTAPAGLRLLLCRFCRFVLCRFVGSLPRVRVTCILLRYIRLPRIRGYCVRGYGWLRSRLVTTFTVVHAPPGYLQFWFTRLRFCAVTTVGCILVRFTTRALVWFVYGLHTCHAHHCHTVAVLPHTPFSLHTPGSAPVCHTPRTVTTHAVAGCLRAFSLPLPSSTGSTVRYAAALRTGLFTRSRFAPFVCVCTALDSHVLRLHTHCTFVVYALSCTHRSGFWLRRTYHSQFYADCVRITLHLLHFLLRLGYAFLPFAFTRLAVTVYTTHSLLVTTRTVTTLRGSPAPRHTFAVGYLYTSGYVHTFGSRLPFFCPGLRSRFGYVYTVRYRVYHCGYGYVLRLPLPFALRLPARILVHIAYGLPHVYVRLFGCVLAVGSRLQVTCHVWLPFVLRSSGYRTTFTLHADYLLPSLPVAAFAFPYTCVLHGYVQFTYRLVAVHAYGYTHTTGFTARVLGLPARTVTCVLHRYVTNSLNYVIPIRSYHILNSFLRLLPRLHGYARVTTLRTTVWFSSAFTLVCVTHCTFALRGCPLRFRVGCDFAFYRTFYVVTWFTYVTHCVTHGSCLFTHVLVTQFGSPVHCCTRWFLRTRFTCSSGSHAALTSFTTAARITFCAVPARAVCGYALHYVSLRLRLPHVYHAFYLPVLPTLLPPARVPYRLLPPLPRYRSPVLYTYTTQLDLPRSYWFCHAAVVPFTGFTRLPVRLVTRAGCGSGSAHARAFYHAPHRVLRGSARSRTPHSYRTYGLRLHRSRFALVRYRFTCGSGYSLPFSHAFARWILPVTFGYGYCARLWLRTAHHTWLRFAVYALHYAHAARFHVYTVHYRYAFWILLPDCHVLGCSVLGYLRAPAVVHFAALPFTRYLRYVTHCIAVTRSVTWFGYTYRYRLRLRITTTFVTRLGYAGSLRLLPLVTRVLRWFTFYAFTRTPAHAAQPRVPARTAVPLRSRLHAGWFTRSHYAVCLVRGCLRLRLFTRRTPGLGLPRLRTRLPHSTSSVPVLFWLILHTFTLHTFAHVLVTVIATLRFGYPQVARALPRLRSRVICGCGYAHRTVARSRTVRLPARTHLAHTARLPRFTVGSTRDRLRFGLRFCG